MNDLYKYIPNCAGYKYPETDMIVYYDGKLNPVLNFTEYQSVDYVSLIGPYTYGYRVYWSVYWTDNGIGTIYIKDDWFSKIKDFYNEKFRKTFNTLIEN